MQNGETNTPLFDTIGHGAEQVDSLTNGDDGSQKLVEEIESMCINCEENVRSLKVERLMMIRERRDYS